ncbi:hypothetical protein ACF1BU_06075 [Streptomyces sp. NPDC014724]
MGVDSGEVDRGAGELVLEIENHRLKETNAALNQQLAASGR